MKIIRWKLPTILAMISMLIGFVVSFTAISSDNNLMVIIGQGIIIFTCVLWWVWVMMTVYEIIESNRETMDHILEIRAELIQVKGILYQTSKDLNIKDK